MMISVLDVDAVDSADQNFSASVYMEARWKDPNLAHENSHPRVAPLTAVWTPRLTILNQQQAWKAYPSYVEISPDGEVILRQKFWGWFSQPLNLRDFPFDRQTLRIHVVAAGLHQTDVTMLPLILRHGRMSTIAQKFSLPDFEVVSWNAEPQGFFLHPDQPGTAGFLMEIIVERNPVYFIWKLILPLCLIVSMSWVPRWLPVSETGTNVGIAATSVLTLVAYLFATALLLPPVSYLTRMDNFILSSNVIVFAGLLQTVLTSTLVKNSDSRTAERVNRASRLIYPLILFGVLYISFLHGR